MAFIASKLHAICQAGRMCGMACGIVYASGVYGELLCAIIIFLGLRCVVTADEIPAVNRMAGENNQARQCRQLTISQPIK